jgi:hypothetical protein
MESETFDALRAAVNIARQYQTRGPAQLRRIMTQSGFTDDQITKALAAWASYEKSKRREMHSA